MQTPLRASLLALSLASLFAFSADARELRMTTIMPEGTLNWNLFPLRFVEILDVVSRGEVKVKPYPLGVLSGFVEGRKAVEDGRADMAFHYPAVEINASPASAFISDLPGGLGPDAKLIWILEGGGKEIWEEYRHSQGLHGLLCGLMGSELFANSHKRIQSLEDLKGYRYRTAGAAADVIRKLGGAPVLVPGPEVFTLLERKGIDGAEYLDPFGNYSFGFHKIAKYAIYPGIHAPGGNYELLMKKSTWDNFTEEQQKFLQFACDSTLLRSFAALNFNNAKSMKEMDESPNTELVELDRELIDAIRAAGREWVDAKIKEEEAKGESWVAKFAKSYFGFQDMWSQYSSYQVIDRK